MLNSTYLRPINSTSYADVAGLPFGLARRSGESATAFLQRLYSAANSRRDHSYEGMLEELALRLGLSLYPGATITAPAGTTIQTGFGRIAVISAGVTSTVPTATVAADSYIEWRTLADVLADLGQLPGISTTLVKDVWGYQIARQTNVFLVQNEAITSQQQTLAHSGIRLNTILFNQTVGNYTLTTDGKLLLPGAPGAGLTATYQYEVLPYSLVCSDIGLFSLSDPAINGMVSDGVLPYQVREFIQAVMQQDRSYWAE